MKGQKLFSQVVHRRRRRQTSNPDQPDTNAPYSNEEIAQIRRALQSSGTSASCPRHGSDLRVEGPIARGENAVWLVRCDSCQRSLTLRAGPNRRPEPPAFDDLVVSNPKNEKLGKSLPATMVSLTLHGGMLVAAVMATAGAAEVIQEPQHDTTLVYLTVEKKPEQKVAPPPESAPKQQIPPVLIVSLQPPPQGFQVVSVPIDIPTDIPPVDFSEQFDPRDFSGIGVEGGVFDGVKGATGSVDASRLFRAAAVDERPERLSGPPLLYPLLLRRAGISGFVLIEFVINSSGRVEPSSIRIVSSSHRAFERPAIETISASLFRPGRVWGTAVRVLVRQQIDFHFVAGS